MAIHAGRHRLSTQRGRIVLTTMRDGLAAQAGHDLTLEAERWSGELVVGEDLTPARLDVRIDMGSLVVRDGTGGLKPLTEKDKRDIAVAARKVLAADRHPEATFSATDFQPAGGSDGARQEEKAGHGVISGTLTLAGRSRPLRLEVREPEPGDYRATAAIRQSEFGIKPYSAFLGSLKVRDAVGLQVELSLPPADSDAAAEERA